MSVFKIHAWLMGLVWILIPIAHYRVWPDIPLYVAEIPLIGCALLLIGSRSGRERLTVGLERHGFFFVVLAAFVFGAAIPFLRDTAPYAALGLFKSWVLLPTLFAALLMFARPHREVIRLWLTLWWSGLAAAASAALLTAGMGYFTYDGRLTSGLFTSPNELAMLLSPGILVGIWLQQFYTGRQQLMVRVATAAMVWAVVLTQSYSALGALVVVGVGYLFALRGSKTSEYTALIAVLVFFLFVWIAPTQKFHDLVNFGERSSLASRSMIWRAAGTILADSFPWGIGVGQFQTWYLTYQTQFPPYLEWAVPEPHNLVLAVLLATGAVGTIAFFWSFVWAIRQLLKAIPAADDQPEFSLPMLLLMLFAWWFLVGLVDTPFFRQSASLMYFGLIGIVLAYTSQESDAAIAPTN